MKRADRAALIAATRAGGIQSRAKAAVYPEGWFDEPLFVLTASHVKVHHRIVEEPIWQDEHALAALMRSLVEEARAKGRGTRGYIPPSVWAPILAAFGHRCAYCGCSGVPLERDHRIAVSRGGTDDPENLVPACKPCNVRKSNQDPQAWPLAVEPVW